MSASLFATIFEQDGRLHATTTPADHLAFALQPTAIVAGNAFTSGVSVDILNSAGAVDTTSNAAVTIAISGSGEIAGTTTVLATSGVAVFSDLTVASAGGFKLLASAASISVGSSAAFLVSPDVSSAHPVVLQHPLSLPVGKTFAPAISVAIEDQFGNVITGDPTQVSLNLTDGLARGSLTGATTVETKNGLAKFGTLSIPLAGTYTLQASDAALANADSDPVEFEILQGVTTITAPRAGGAAVFGGTVTLSASLRSTADRNIPFTGTATLLDANHNVLGSINVNSAGQMKFSVTGLGLGAYACTIAYSGDANRTSLVTAPFPLQITAAPTHVSFSSSANAPVFGEELQLDAAVTTRFSPSAPPTGSVTFLDHGSTIGSVTVDSFGHATLTVPSAAIGPHSITAVYSGDGEFQFSAAQMRDINVSKAPTVTSLRGPMTGLLGAGQLVSLSVNVYIRSPVQGQLIGTVTFRDGSRIIATVPLDGTGAARFTTSFAGARGAPHHRGIQRRWPG